MATPGSYEANLRRRVLSRADRRAEHVIDFAGWPHLKNVAMQRGYLHYFVKVLVPQIDVQMFCIESGDEEFSRAGQVNGIRRRGGQRAMPQLHEFDTALVLLLRILEHFIRFHIQESQPHGALAHDAFQMADAAAATIAFARIERHHYVAAFPDAFAPRINSKAHAIAERPDANEAVQISVRRR